MEANKVPDKLKLGNKILEIRKKNGLSQEEFAEKLNVTRQMVSKWEIGAAIPRSEKIDMICKEFNISADVILGNKVKSVDVNDNLNSNESNRSLHISSKKIKGMAAIFIVVLLLIYIGFSIYKFCIFTHVFNELKRYEKLNNYYCRIIEYGDTQLIEDTEIWYKDGIYKIKTQAGNSINTKILYIDTINLKKNKIIDNNKIEETILEEDNNNLFKDGKMLYKYFIEDIKENVNIFSSLIIDNFEYKSINDKKILKYNNKYIEMNNENYLPIMIMEQNRKGENKDNFLETIMYYNIKLDSVTDEDIK